MNRKIRMQTLLQAPISYKDRDILVGAEKYLKAIEGFDLIEMIIDYYNVPNQESIKRIKLIWEYQFISWILHNHKSGNHLDDQIKSKAIQIYDQEAQRYLSSIFHLDHPFWKSYYKLQQEELTKPLCALESLDQLSSLSIDPIHHQLLCLSIKSILLALSNREEANYKQNQLEKEIQLKQALRFLGDLPFNELKNWIKKRLNTKL